VTAAEISEVKWWFSMTASLPIVLPSVSSYKNYSWCDLSVHMWTIWCYNHRMWLKVHLWNFCALCRAQLSNFFLLVCIFSMVIIVTCEVYQFPSRGKMETYRHSTGSQFNGIFKQKGGCSRPHSSVLI
jgi:hypothetical protein